MYHPTIPCMCNIVHGLACRLCGLNCIGNQHENAVCTSTVVRVSEQEI